MLSDSNARLAAARGLTSPKVRRETGRFLAEGAQAVREALGRPDLVIEVFGTAAALARHADLIDRAPAGQVSEISDRAAAGLSETVHPQGLLAVCRRLDLGLAEALSRRPRLVAMLVEANDPGNAGTILRTADAAGADTVILAGDSVDLYNGKLIRATAGSLFHLDLVTGPDPVEAIRQCQAAGFLTAATSGLGSTDLDDLVDGPELARPTVWVFGNEARGLPSGLIELADLAVRVPIHGAAESLNLSAAAALCLYSSARAQRRGRLPDSRPGKSGEPLS